MELFITLAAIIAFILPTLVVLYRNLWFVRTLRYFVLYWLLGAIVNLTDFLPGLTSRHREIITIIYNVIDIPLMLAILYNASRSFKGRKFTLISGSVFVVTAIVGILTEGFYYDSMKYSLGFGLLLVILIAGWNFRLYFRKIRYTPYQKAMMLVYAAVLFEFGSFVVIYVFDYFAPGRSGNDNFLIYYTSSIITGCIALTGLLIPALPEGAPITGIKTNKKEDHSKMA